tara:strand:- start:237 stop:1034 length:798 start_codon:yes stop_codon:yes gene_type:complete
MKFLILGSRGMLGSMAKSFFEKKHEVIVFDQRFSQSTFNSYLHYIKELDFDILLNCIGRIPQKSLNYDELYLSNTLLPKHLAEIEKDFLLVHPSTDCVFSGLDRKDPYRFDEPHDFKDDYGFTKSAAESFVLKRSDSLVIRTSIIGTTPQKNSKGLLDWYLNQDDHASLKGYTNHHWNGITTLEWCKFLTKLIEEKYFLENNLMQVSSSHSISKYELLIKFKKIFEKKSDIEKFETEKSINRTLYGQIELKSIDKQLVDLRDYEV